MFVVFKIY